MIAACPFPGNRGTPSRVLKMSESLSRLGYEIDILTYYNRDFEFPKSKIKVYRVKKISFYKDNSPGPKIWKPYVDFLLYKKGKELIRKNRYHIIHAHHIEGGFVGVKLKRELEIPLIYDSHIILEREIKSYGIYSLLNNILKKIETYCYKKSDACVYVDGEIKKYTDSKKLTPKITEVVPTGTNINELESIIKIKNFYFDKKNINIVYTGSISKFQDVDDIFHVANLLKNENIKFFIITGAKQSEGKYLIDLMKKLKLKNIEIKFNQSFEKQMEHIYFSDIVLSPRKDCGGIPQKITNYMVFAKKIVCCDGSAKVLNHENAFIYKKDNLIEFKNKILEAIKDKKNIKGKNARKTVEKYDWDYLIKKIDKLYNKLK